MPTNSNKTELAYRTYDEDNRRMFMKKMVALFGATTAAAVLSGCSEPVTKQVVVQEETADNGELLSEQDKTGLYSLCETILPKTDTPSAVEVGCHEFVPHQLQHCHSKQQQDVCTHIINKVDLVANGEFGKSFSLLQPPQQQQLLLDFETNNMSTENEKGQFRFLKALIVFGYFTSEVGVTKVLDYQPVPGGFVGSIPANADTKSSSPQPYY
jgi:hypothetical protein